MEFINKILEWPVIIQGILGSFLFWMIFTIGQWIGKLSINKIKQDNELGGFWGRTARDDFYKGNFNLSNFSFFICLYGSIHYFLKFVLVVFISYIISDFVPVFAFVGHILGFYFIFRAISYVTHFSTFDREDEKAGKMHPYYEAKQKNPKSKEVTDHGSE
jgi:hypothetical protein